MKVDTHKVDGQSYDIDFSPATGRFTTEIDGDSIYADSLALLKKKMVATKRKAAVRIALLATMPFGKATSRWNSRGDEVTELLDVIVTGIHQRNRTVLLKRANDNKALDPIEGREGELFVRLDATAKAELLRLAKASREARAAFQEFVATYSYSKQKIETEVSKAESKAGIDADDED